MICCDEKMAIPTGDSTQAEVTHARKYEKSGFSLSIQSGNFTGILKKLFSAYQDPDLNLEVCNLRVTQSQEAG
jgi:hypothetical protein